MFTRFLLVVLAICFSHTAWAARGGGSVQLGAASFEVAEAAGFAIITVTRTGTLSGPESVDYSTSDGTATAGLDYTHGSGTVSWASGEGGSKTFLVAVLDDEWVEADEIVHLTLSNPRRGTLGEPNAATLAIRSDDSYGTLRFSQEAFASDEDSGSAVITVERVQGRSGEVSARYRTIDDSASAGTDYTAVSGTLVWVHGDDTPKSFSVPLTADTVAEADETVFLELSLAYGSAAQLGDPHSATLTIDNDDLAGNVQFSHLVYQATEGQGTVSATVTRRFGSDGVVTVDYGSSDGTALAGGDYTPVNGTLSWGHGDASPRTISVQLLPDGFTERRETAALSLSNITGGASFGGARRAILLIEDGENIPPANAIESGGGSGGRNGGSGGEGGQVVIEKWKGSGSVEVLAGGSVRADFVPTLIAPDLGNRPLVVTADTVVREEIYYDGEPPVGTIYFDGFYPYLFIADGDGSLFDADERVTGLMVAEGATLTLVPADVTAWYVLIEFSHDLANYGTITTDTREPHFRRPGLWLIPERYISEGVIHLSGAREGQDAGHLEIEARTAIYNHGDIHARGADHATGDAGQGEYVSLRAPVVESSGQIVTDGGWSGAASGGSAGSCWLRGGSALYVSGRVSNRGGDGVSLGGMGSGVLFETVSGEMRISAPIVTQGGHATDGDAGSGGYSNIIAHGGDLSFNAAYDARGGETLAAAGKGGAGGWLNLWTEHYYDTYGSSPTVPAGSLFVDGPVVNYGGSSPLAGTGNGGPGGGATLRVNASADPQDQRLLVANTPRIVTRGGDGANAGAGADVEITGDYYYVLPGGATHNEAHIDARGGNVPPSSIGSTIHAGNGGELLITGMEGVVNSGGIDSRGGHDFGLVGGSLATGGRGGLVTIEGHSGDIVSSGSINGNGGDAQYQGGGAAWWVRFTTRASIDNSGDISVDGGDADPSYPGSIGGAAGVIWFDAGGTVTNTGTLSKEPGTGSQ